MFPINIGKLFFAGPLGGCNSADGIYRAGRLSIGTDATLSSARLIVKEGVLTDRTKVELCEYGYWCDYVFKENYELINLDSLQSFITRNKCLPGFLSASELVEQGSFGLKEVTLKQQEKIEEIYLHLLRMTEEVDALVDELDQLQKENKRLKKFGSLTIFAGGSN
ncbi:MAG: hypothetical protein DA408_21210 [Bacteroidetes bacterium]|nr:MAG: hypothetical protein DA408_21210 [Bacteroidota bacterium]